MECLWIAVLNQSLTASYVIVAILLARLLLRRAPRMISYALWAVAGLRLALPLSFESAFGLIPARPAPIPADLGLQAAPSIDSAVRLVDRAVGGALPAAAPAASANPVQIWLTAGAWLWLAGMAVMLLRSAASVLRLKRQLRGAVPVGGNLYRAEGLQTPFVLGLLRPKIYLPAGLAQEEARHILLHEQTHIRRGDHLVKLLAYLLLCLHWFNPLAWVAFLLMGADMEMSCDERVLARLGPETKKAYSLSLLSLAAGRSTVAGVPLAFGEGGVKARIRHVLDFKRPSRRMLLIAVALAVALAAGLLMNRAPGGPPSAVVIVNGIPQALALDQAEDVPYVPLGSVVELRFRGALPDELKVTDILARRGGGAKYSRRLDREVAYVRSGRTVSFAVEFNGAVGLSSNLEDYQPGNTYRWYRVLYTSKAGVRQEYGLYLRTDATAGPAGVRTWLDYYGDATLPWDGSLDLSLPEHGGRTFRWTPEQVAEVTSEGERVLFGGMPVWNVYLADLTGDGLPELCATVSMGSGIVDTRVVVYDCAGDAGYGLADRGVYDYVLSAQDGQLLVTQSAHGGGQVLAVGELALQDGQLVLSPPQSGL
ncbi:MAG: hypothetical protein GXX99_01415 [Clostridiales bacterium]|nr:hypothetical protein [Clostridiales bacterium]